MTAQILHVGAPKSASTWLQTHVLNALDGYEYVGPGAAPELRMATDLLTSLPFQSIPGRLPYLPSSYRQLFSDLSPAVFSFEELTGSLWDRPGKGLRGVDRRTLMNRLGQVFEGATVVFISRDATEFVDSAHSTYLRQGGTLSLPDFRVFMSERNYCDWEYVGESLQELFPRVLRYDYSEIRNDPSSFLIRLERDLGATILGDLEGAVSRRENASLGEFAKSALRALNRFRSSPIHDAPPSFRVRGVSRVADYVAFHS